MLKTCGTGSSSLPLPWLFQAEVGVRRPCCTMLRNKLSSAEKKNTDFYFYWLLNTSKVGLSSRLLKMHKCNFYRQVPIPLGRWSGPLLNTRFFPLQSPHPVQHLDWLSHFYICYASMVLAMALCPSVCLSQVGVLLKVLNVGSHKQHHTIAQGL